MVDVTSLPWISLEKGQGATRRVRSRSRKESRRKHNVEKSVCDHMGDGRRPAGTRRRRQTLGLEEGRCEEVWTSTDAYLVVSEIRRSDPRYLPMLPTGHILGKQHAGDASNCDYMARKLRPASGEQSSLGMTQAISASQRRWRLRSWANTVL